MSPIIFVKVNMNACKLKLLLSSLLAACLALPGAAAAVEKTEEVLLGVRVGLQGLELQVASGGCTSKESFSVEVDKATAPGAPRVLRVWRIRPDNCKAFLPEGVSVNFSREELGLSGAFELIIANRIGNTSRHR